jgi:hypothetical protein
LKQYIQPLLGSGSIPSLASLPLVDALPHDADAAIAPRGTTFVGGRTSLDLYEPERLKHFESLVAETACLAAGEPPQMSQTPGELLSRHRAARCLQNTPDPRRRAGLPKPHVGGKERLVLRAYRA